MVLAISFLETPLKFRAPGVSTALGVAIGRIVFKALNSVEGIFAVAVLVALLLAPHPQPILGAGALVAAAALLALQVFLWRPLMAKRTRGLAEAAATDTRQRADASTSTAPHLLYIGSELLKVVALLVAGVATVMGVLS
ncbi:MAG: hypothetical protein HIU81_04735 [Acidobacteria bacterium]|nr:hypothetical protein [Acidobacteriota bacterium]